MSKILRNKRRSLIRKSGASPLVSQFQLIADDIRSGNRDQVEKSLLELGDDFPWSEFLRIKDENDHTLLELAIYCSNIGATELLLRKGADINVQNSCGHTPLHTVMTLGHFGLAERLMAVSGVQLDVRALDGTTPLGLLVARKLNSEEDVVSARKILRIMAMRGADVNSMNKNGESPLHIAARVGNTEHITTLLAHGANVNAQAKNRVSDTPLMAAVRSGHVKVAELLIQNGADANIESSNGTARKIARSLSKKKYGNRKIELLRLLRSKKEKPKLVAQVVYVETYDDIVARRMHPDGTRTPRPTRHNESMDSILRVPNDGASTADSSPPNKENQKGKSGLRKSEGVSSSDDYLSSGNNTKMKSSGRRKLFGGIRSKRKYKTVEIPKSKLSSSSENPSKEQRGSQVKSASSSERRSIAKRLQSLLSQRSTPDLLMEKHILIPISDEEVKRRNSHVKLPEVDLTVGSQAAKAKRGPPIKLKPPPLSLKTSKLLVDFVASRVMHLQGVFRIRGNGRTIKLLSQNLIDNKLDLDDSIALHDSAGLLKWYFREQPEPLVPYDLYKMFLSCARDFSKKSTPKTLPLPKPNVSHAKGMRTPPPLRCQRSVGSMGVIERSPRSLVQTKITTSSPLKATRTASEEIRKPNLQVKDGLASTSLTPSAAVTGITTPPPPPSIKLLPESQLVKVNPMVSQTPPPVPPLPPPPERPSQKEKMSMSSPSVSQLKSAGIPLPISPTLKAAERISTSESASVPMDDLPSPRSLPAQSSGVQLNLHLSSRKSEALEKLADAFSLLPARRYKVFRVLLSFLHELSKHAELTKMTSKNLGIVFSPAFIRPEKATMDMAAINLEGRVAEIMIEHFPRIFPDYQRYNASGVKIFFGNDDEDSEFEEETPAILRDDDYESSSGCSDSSEDE